MELTLDLPRAAAAAPRADRASAPTERTPTDEQLLGEIARGDRTAFETLYGRYARAMLGLALRRLRDRGRAEEAVQEAFASVWRSASSFRAERGRGAAWLFAVARNAISDRGRARTEPPVEPADEPSPSPGPDETVEQGWVAWRVHRALEELPAKERELIELAYWGGLSQSEIAGRLGVPLGTVKTRTRSALGRLADALEGELQ